MFRRRLLFDDDTAMAWMAWGIAGEGEAEPEPEPGQAGVTAVLAIRDTVTATMTIRDSVTATMATGG